MLVVAAIVMAILVKTLLVQIFFIPSASMEPTLRPGDRIVVCRICTTISPVRRGQIVVFADPHPAPGPGRGVLGGAVHWLGEAIGVASPADDDFVKRVIGLPGDVVELHDGRLFVNGRVIDEPYLDPRIDTTPYGPVTVPDGMLFVLGDNRTDSGDSRFEPPRGVGLVPQDEVIGTVVYRIWPPSRAGTV
jgi:signal peptidase I